MYGILARGHSPLASTDEFASRPHCRCVDVALERRPSLSLMAGGTIILLKLASILSVSILESSSPQYPLALSTTSAPVS